MKRLNWKNLLKLLVMAYCVGIVVYDIVCIFCIFAQYTWLGFIEFILALTLVLILYKSLNTKKENL